MYSHHVANIGKQASPAFDPFSWDPGYYDPRNPTQGPQRKPSWQQNLKGDLGKEVRGWFSSDQAFHQGPAPKTKFDWELATLVPESWSSVERLARKGRLQASPEHRYDATVGPGGIPGFSDMRHPGYDVLSMADLSPTLQGYNPADPEQARRWAIVSGDVQAYEDKFSAKRKKKKKKSK